MNWTYFEPIGNWTFLNETLGNWTFQAVTIQEKIPMPWYQNPWVGVVVGLVALAIFWTPSILRMWRTRQKSLI